MTNGTDTLTDAITQASNQLADAINSVWKADRMAKENGTSEQNIFCAR